LSTVTSTVTGAHSRHLKSDSLKKIESDERIIATGLYELVEKQLEKLPDNVEHERIVSIFVEGFKDNPNLLSLLLDASDKCMPMHRDSILTWAIYTDVTKIFKKTKNANSTASPVAQQPQMIVGDMRRSGRAKRKGKADSKSLIMKSQVRDNRTVLQTLKTRLAETERYITSMTSEVDAGIDILLESLDSNISEVDRQLVLQDLYDYQMMRELITHSPEYKAEVLRAKQLEKRLKEKLAKKNERVENMRNVFGMPNATEAELHELDRKQKENIANQDEALPLSKIEIKSLTRGDEVSKVAGQRAGRGRKRPTKKKLAAVHAVRKAKEEHMSILRKHKAQRKLKLRQGKMIILIHKV
jgi:hypothetical protein